MKNTNESKIQSALARRLLLNFRLHQNVVLRLQASRKNFLSISTTNKLRWLKKNLHKVGGLRFFRISWRKSLRLVNMNERASRFCFSLTMLEVCNTPHSASGNLALRSMKSHGRVNWPQVAVSALRGITICKRPSDSFCRINLVHWL